MNDPTASNIISALEKHFPDTESIDGRLVKNYVELVDLTIEYSPACPDPYDPRPVSVERTEKGCLPEGDASDCVVILDPPYLGDISREKPTTGYAHASSRETVLMLAKAWREAGAMVLLHEAVELTAELGTGWIERPASPLRSRGSTFWGGEGEREWITASKPPVWWPERQQPLFAGVSG